MRTRFQGCCVDGKSGPWKIDDIGCGRHGGGVNWASPCMVPMSFSHLSALAPSLCPSFRLRLSQLVIRFPHLLLACHLAYPISRFPISHLWAEKHHPTCSILVQLHL